MKSKILMIVVQVLLLAVAGGATWWFTQGNKPPAVEASDAAAASPASKQPLYYSIEPAFVVNLLESRAVRFLQIQVDLMTRQNDVIPMVEKYLPRIRNDLIMLFAKLNRDSIATEEARLKIQQDALAVINAVLEQEGGRGGIEAVYFSKFVMQ